MNDSPANFDFGEAAGPGVPPAAGDAALSPCARGPGLLALAAYIDGTLEGAERDAIAQHLAECDACRDTCAEVGEGALHPESSMIFAPHHVMDAAMALVPAGARNHNTDHRRPVEWVVTVRRGLAAAAALAICALGYATGATLSANGASPRPAESLDAAISFGLFDQESIDGSAVAASDLFSVDLPEDQS